MNFETYIRSFEDFQPYSVHGFPDRALPTHKKIKLEQFFILRRTSFGEKIKLDGFFTGKTINKYKKINKSLRRRFDLDEKYRYCFLGSFSRDIDGFEILVPLNMKIPYFGTHVGVNGFVIPFENRKVIIINEIKEKIFDYDFSDITLPLTPKQTFKYAFEGLKMPDRNKNSLILTIIGSSPFSGKLGGVGLTTVQEGNVKTMTRDIERYVKKLKPDNIGIPFSNLGVLHFMKGYDDYREIKYDNRIQSLMSRNRGINRFKEIGWDVGINENTLDSIKIPSRIPLNRILWSSELHSHIYSIDMGVDYIPKINKDIILTLLLMKNRRTKISEDLVLKLTEKVRKRSKKSLGFEFLPMDNGVSARILDSLSKFTGKKPEKLVDKALDLIIKTRKPVAEIISEKIESMNLKDELLLRDKVTTKIVEYVVRYEPINIDMLRDLLEYEHSIDRETFDKKFEEIKNQEVRLFFIDKEKNIISAF